MKHIRNKFCVDSIIALLIFCTVLAVYNATLTPSLSYKSPDGNEMATIPYILGLAHSTGYPLYTWLGKLFTYIPIGDVAHRVNLMSAVMGAGGVVLLYKIMRELTSVKKSSHQWISRIASGFTALLFAFSVTFWSQTGIAEVYSPNIFMICLVVWLLLRWARAMEEGEPKAMKWLWAFGLAYGLSLGTHMSNLGFAPGFALFILLVDWRILIHLKELLGTAAAFGLGILQFAWLPYKASTLNDAPMMHNAPHTLQGIYNYTLGAFPQFKFAFPLTAIPERIVLYLYLLKQQYFLVGILLGFHGLTEMLLRKPKRFFLFVTMYLAQVIFFIQYRAFDLDVFFIPANVIFAIFIGFSVYHLAEYLWGLVGGLSGIGFYLVKPTVGFLLILVLLTPLVKELKINWAINDYSEDISINDFYDNVWKLLPLDSVILGRSGVFGYDMFYFRLVYDVRPDVLIPLLDTPTPNPDEMSGRDIYTTMLLNSSNTRPGPGALPPGLVDDQSWYVPILLGQSSSGFGGRGRELTLYRVTDKPPKLVEKEPQPQFQLNLEVDGWRLLGFDLENDTTMAGGSIHLVLYWQNSVNKNSNGQLPLIATALDETLLETHEIGLGNIRRYIQEFQPPRDGIIVEDYSIVIPSLLETGDYQLRIGLQEAYPPNSKINFQGPSFELGTIHVQEVVQ